MIPGGVERCQRWGGGREAWRPAGELVDVSRFDVETIPEDVAKAFVTRHHYSGSYPAASCRVGLFRRELGHVRELAGVAVFSVPPQAAAIRRWTGTDAGLELGRFVLLENVEGNGETFFLSQAFRVLAEEKPGISAVLSYADPMVRLTAEGRIVTPGHVGTIYQAHNGRHVGRSEARWSYFDRDGRIVSRRALSKVRGDEIGAGGAYAGLLAQGAPERRPFEEGAAYVARVLAEAPWTRIRHPGNLAYVWGVGAGKRAARRALPEALPYPKRDAVVDPAREVAA